MSNITDAELDRLHNENLVMSVQVERQLKLIEGLKPLARLGIEAIEASQQGSLLYNPNLQDMGILIKTTFDPAKHTDTHGLKVNSGDLWFEFPPAVMAAKRALEEEG